MPTNSISSVSKESQKHMKIVVTGAVGHIGSHLSRKVPDLFGDDAEVIMIDDMTTQRYPSLFDLPEGARYRFVEADVTAEESDLAGLFKGADVVVHLAAITDAARSFERKDLVERVNFAATENVAKACAEAGVPMIFPSSTSVYGTQEDKVDEDSGPSSLNPQSPYAETKLREEEYLADIADEIGLSYVTCRLGTIFGPSPGMRFHTAVNRFCWQAIMGEPLTVWTTALDQMRPYLSLEDVARAFAHITKENAFDNRVYNVLTANATVRDVVDTIRTHIPDLEVKLVDNKIMNQLSYEVGNDRFKNLGFTFEGSIAAGIGKTMTQLRRANSA